MSKNKNPLFVLLVLVLLAACVPVGSGKSSECDSAIFVDHVILDVPVEIGSLVMPGTHFTKTWRVLNGGDCEWTTDYALVLVNGSGMGAPEEWTFDAVVAPGESAEISLVLTAPSEAGAYRGEWMLHNADGELFGIGAAGDKPLIAELEVADLPAGTVYAFEQMHCLAEWHSNLATYLSCEGGEDEEDIRSGYVRLVDDASLEGGDPNNALVIEMKPNNQAGGWINGSFPPITLSEGDHFVANIGCLGGNADCSILFQLDYELTDGSGGRLGEWTQIYDDEAAQIDVDLSQFAGERPRLILRVEENGGRTRQAIGYWLDARIVRAE